MNDKFEIVASLLHEPGVRAHIASALCVELTKAKLANDEPRIQELYRTASLLRKFYEGEES